VIRFLIVMFAAVPVTIWYACRIFWGVFIRKSQADCVCEYVPRAWSRAMLRIAGVRVTLENESVVDPAQSQILVSNHVSWFDVVAIAGYVPGSYRFVAKKELIRVPFFGPAVAACGHIMLDRKDREAALESLEAARRRLENRSPTIIMFPEGTRSATGELQPFKKGAFVLAIQTGTDVVPAAVIGSRAVMRKHALAIRPGTIHVRFGEPIPVVEYTIEDRDVLTRRAWEAVSSLRNAPANP
jgi:1-acyl-sn-glycerol-3-phosphate acyltransferase